MAQTIPDIIATKDWQSVNALTGIDIGKPINLQTKGAYHRVITALGTQPAADSRDGLMLTPMERKTTIAAGSLEVWVRTVSGNCRIFVEEV